MTDRPISDLGVASSVGTGDYLILNKQNASTERVAFETILAALGSGGGGGEDGTPGIGGFGFAPQFHNFPSTNNFTIDAVTWATQQTNIHGSSNVKTIKMPANADRALISFQYTASVSQRVNQGEPGYNIAQFGGQLALSGATAAAGCGTSTTSICMGANLSQYTNSTASEAQPGSSFVVSVSPIKFSMLTFTKGATVSFTAGGTLQRAKKCIAVKSVGRMIVFPFNSSAIDIGTMQDIIDAANDNTDYDIAPAPFPNEEAAAQAEFLTEEMKYIVSIGRKVLDDPNFDQNATSTTPLPNLTVQALMDMVYTIKKESQEAGYDKNFLEIEAELDDILASMKTVPGAGVSFPSLGAGSGSYFI